MKLSPVLSKYLAINKQLNLPGLGTFYNEDSYDPNIDFTKKSDILSNISFEQKKIEGFDDSLVDFVSKETGKMKVLALSDLTSQLDDMLHYLNTGKEYALPGIGSLGTKVDGSYEFQREKRFQVEKRKELQANEQNTVPKTFIDDKPHRSKSNRPAIIILILTALAVAATAWFYFKSNSQSKSEEIVQNDSSSAVPTADTAKTTLNDSAQQAQVVPVPDFYKYIIETAAQPRASKRFSQLKTLNWPVELETKDSITFNITMKLPIAGADTTRIKDSLSALSGRKVVISP